jgi:hypothetical protein
MVQVTNFGPSNDKVSKLLDQRDETDNPTLLLCVLWQADHTNIDRDSMQAQ